MGVNNVFALFWLFVSEVEMTTGNRITYIWCLLRATLSSSYFKVLGWLLAPVECTVFDGGLELCFDCFPRSLFTTAVPHSKTPFPHFF